MEDAQGADGANGEEIMIDGDDLEEETQPTKIAPSPQLPSAEEVEEHRISHLPFRNWCRECVEGKALGEHRGARPGGESMVPVVGVDYFYLTLNGMFHRSELADFPQTEEGETALKEARVQATVVCCILMRCSRTKNIFAHVLPHKGVDENGYIVKLLVKDLRWLGHTRLIVKADNEPALQKLVKLALRELNVTAADDGLEQAGQEQSPPYDSQANGLTEVGIRMLRAQFRTVKACLQRRLGKRIPEAHPIAAWLLEHCCMLMKALQRGSDGMTPWLRARGRPFGKRLVGFGETVLYKLTTKEPAYDARGNSAAR